MLVAVVLSLHPPAPHTRQPTPAPSPTSTPQPDPPPPARPSGRQPSERRVTSLPPRPSPPYPPPPPSLLSNPVSLHPPNPSSTVSGPIPARMPPAAPLQSPRPKAPTPSQAAGPSVQGRHPTSRGPSPILPQSRMAIRTPPLPSQLIRTVRNARRRRRRRRRAWRRDMVFGRRPSLSPTIPNTRRLPPPPLHTRPRRRGAVPAPRRRPAFRSPAGRGSRRATYSGLPKDRRSASESRPTGTDARHSPLHQPRPGSPRRA